MKNENGLPVRLCTVGNRPILARSGERILMKMRMASRPTAFQGISKIGINPKFEVACRPWRPIQQSSFVTAVFR